MLQTLISENQRDELARGSDRRGELITFQQCLREAQLGGNYHRKLFILMALHIVSASIFLGLPFFIFKMPLYCDNVNDIKTCCLDGNIDCIDDVCKTYASEISSHIKQDQSLTIKYQLYCNKNWIRIAYQILPQCLGLIGFLIYGKLSDIKGRKVAIKISWRMYCVGIFIFSLAQTELLKTIGYVLSSIHCFPTLILKFILFFQHNGRKEKNKQSLLLLACLSIGPLLLSLFSLIGKEQRQSNQSYLTQIDNRILLGISCTLPAFLLAFFDKYIIESPICRYRFNKDVAFGLINAVAKRNSNKPIMIDLSQSIWYKYSFPSTGLLSLLKIKKLRNKIFFGFLFICAISFNIKISQISLDIYAETIQRSLYVNISTFLADLTLCILLVRVKNPSFRFMTLGIAIAIASLLAFSKIFQDNTESMSLIVIVHSVLIRYMSELCNGLLLIWSIQAFSTICRGFCVGVVWSGSCLGFVGAYLIKGFMFQGYIGALVASIFLFIGQKFLYLEDFGIMKDTLDERYYDQNDKYYRNLI